MTMAAPTGDIELDKRLAGVIGRAVMDTFNIMVRVKPVVGQFEIIDRPSVHGDISGIMNIVGDDLEGAFILSFPKETVFHILARVYGNAFHEITPSVQDAVAEFTNVIYGVVKAGLVTMGLNLRMALPNVVIGDQHKVVSPQTGPCLLLPVHVLNYTFQVVLYIRKVENK